MPSHSPIHSVGLLEEAVGESISDDFRAAGDGCVLAKVAPDGSVTYWLIDSEEYVIRGSAGNFNP